MAGVGAGDDDFFDKFAFLACRHPVVDKVILDRQGAQGLPFAQYQLCAEGNQQRWRVANGRGIADVAAQGALIADLQGGEALQQFAEVRVLGLERAVGVCQRHRRADFNTVIKALDVLHFGHVADVDHDRQRAMKLGHLKRQVGTAGQQAGLGLGFVQLGQVADGHGQQAALVAAVKFAGLGRGDGLEQGNGRALVCIELILLLPAASLFGSRQNRAVAGAATEVARQGFMGLMAIRLARAVFLQGEQ